VTSVGVKPQLTASVEAVEDFDTHLPANPLSIAVAESPQPKYRVKIIKIRSGNGSELELGHHHHFCVVTGLYKT
jgi:hypothetical protein